MAWIYKESGNYAVQALAWRNVLSLLTKIYKPLYTKLQPKFKPNPDIPHNRSISQRHLHIKCFSDPRRYRNHTGSKLGNWQTSYKKHRKSSRRIPK
jgi:hypothetical protein